MTKTKAGSRPFFVSISSAKSKMATRRCCCLNVWIRYRTMWRCQRCCASLAYLVARNTFIHAAVRGMVHAKRRNLDSYVPDREVAIRIYVLRTFLRTKNYGWETTIVIVSQFITAASPELPVVLAQLIKLNRYLDFLDVVWTKELPIRQTDRQTDRQVCVRTHVVWQAYVCVCTA